VETSQMHPSLFDLGTDFRHKPYLKLVTRCFTVSTVFRLSEWLRREWPNLMLGGLLVVLTGNALIAARGPRDLILLRERRTQLEAKRAQLTSQKLQLETTVQNLRSNDRYLEHLIRKELGYARSDELVYKFTAAEDMQKQTAGVSQNGTRKQSVLAGLTLQLLSEIGVR
jgi:cell division protein FtsB